MPDMNGFDKLQVLAYMDMHRVHFKAKDKTDVYTVLEGRSNGQDLPPAHMSVSAATCRH